MTMIDDFGTASFVNVLSDNDLAHKLANDEITDSIEDSTWVENTDSIPLGNSPESMAAAPDYKLDKIAEDGQFYVEMIRRCEASAFELDSAKSLSDIRAREHLIVIAEMVADSRFDIDVFGLRTERRVTKAHHHNQHAFVMQWITPDRDRQLVSKQALALRYAVGQCNGDVSKLRTFFETTSIWPAAGFEDTELSVFIEPEAYHGASEVYE